MQCCVQKVLLSRAGRHCRGMVMEAVAGLTAVSSSDGPLACLHDVLPAMLRVTLGFQDGKGLLERHSLALELVVANGQMDGVCLCATVAELLWAGTKQERLLPSYNQSSPASQCCLGSGSQWARAPQDPDWLLIPPS